MLRILWCLKKAKILDVVLDLKLTPELEEEGYARQISRQVQAFRKEIGLEKKDKIILHISSDKDAVKMFNSQKNMILERTNSKSIEITEEPILKKFKHKKSFKIKDKKGEISILLN